MRAGIDDHLDILVGDVRESLRSLLDGSVDCVVTSPPYFGLRDYAGEPSVWGGGEGCAHEWADLPPRSVHGSTYNEGLNERTGRPVGQRKQERAQPRTVGQGAWCALCGGWRGQLGLEPTPQLYVEHLVEVFREVLRVLAPYGTCWVVLGDSFAEKNLIQVPARVALALQDAGWWLRSDVIWDKPNAMPDSATDRPTMSHEHVLLLTKQPRYYYDGWPLREPAKWERWGAQTNGKYQGRDDAKGAWIGPHSREEIQALGGGTKAARSVWRIPTQSFSARSLGFKDGDHFAPFPEELVRRCVEAGCPEWVCGTCGVPVERVIEYGEKVPVRGAPIDEGGVTIAGMSAGSSRLVYNADKTMVRTDLGWSFLTRSIKGFHWSDCGHDDRRRGVVLDPFLGSGTTAVVARRAGRRTVGCELNEQYVEIAAARYRVWWRQAAQAAPRLPVEGQLELA